MSSRHTAVALLVTLGVACRAAPIPDGQRFPTGTPFTAHFARIDDLRIRYIDAGAGTPVLFIHGLGASMYAWRKNLAPVMAAGFRVVALMDSLHLPDAVLVGHSMGGEIAAEVAIAFPTRVRGLVLMAAAGLGTREPLLFRVGRWPVVGPLMLAFRGRALAARLLRSTYADPRKVTESDVDQYYAPVAEAAYGRALRGVLREFRFGGLEGRLDAIGAPTLVLWGEADRWIPIALGRALAAQLNRSAFLSVRHAGHSVQEEVPDEVNRLVIKFLEEGLPRVPGNLAWAGWRPHDGKCRFHQPYG